MKPRKEDEAYGQTEGRRWTTLNEREEKEEQELAKENQKQT